MPNIPYRSLDLPPQLTSTEWVWFFGLVAEGAAAALKESVASEVQAKAEIAALGRPVPWKGKMEQSLESRQPEWERQRTSYQRILDMATFMLVQAQQQDAEEFAQQMADYFSGRAWSE